VTPDLTPRQLQVLRHATRKGLWIARRLAISPETVKNHFTNIYRALGIRGGTGSLKRWRALHRALGLGLLALGDVDPADDERAWPEDWHWGWHPEFNGGRR
jgi:DNA-binding CsgD family transcriptional regulator